MTWLVRCDYYYHHKLERPGDNCVCVISYSNAKRPGFVACGLRTHIWSWRTDHSTATFGDTWQKINCCLSFLWIGYCQWSDHILLHPWFVFRDGWIVETSDNKCAVYWRKNQVHWDYTLERIHLNRVETMLPTTEWNFVDSIRLLSEGLLQPPLLILHNSVSHKVIPRSYKLPLRDCVVTVYVATLWG